MSQLVRQEIVDNILTVYKTAVSAKIQLQNKVRRVALLPLEQKYTKKVQDAVLLWQKQWNSIAASVGKRLYPIAQRQLNITKSGSILMFPGELPTILKARYDIPEHMQAPINSAFTITPEVKGFIQANFNHMDAAYNVAASSLAKQLGVTVAFQLRDADIIAAMKARANMLAGNVSETVFKRLKYRVATSYAEGKHPTLPTTHPVTGERLTSVADDVSGFFKGQVKRARVVARTETAIIQSAAEYDYNQRIGVTKHGWMTAGDMDVRPAHVLNNGVVVAIGKPFPSGQSQVGEGAPELVIQCRCSNYPVPPPPGQIKPWDGSKTGRKGTSLPKLPKGN